MQQQEVDRDTIAAAEWLLANKSKNSSQQPIKAKAKRGRPKGRKTTTHPDIKRPSRPLSSYNLFFRDERRKIVEDANDLDGEPNADPNDTTKKTSKTDLDFTGIARTIGARWKVIDEMTKKSYEMKASEEMEKYREGMKVFNRKLEELTKAETTRDKESRHDGDGDDDDTTYPKKTKYTKNNSEEQDTGAEAITHDLTAEVRSPRNLLLSVRKRRFEAAADGRAASSSATEEKQLPDVARPIVQYNSGRDEGRAFDLEAATSSSFQRPQQQPSKRVRGITELLDQKMRLQMMMDASTSLLPTSTILRHPSLSLSTDPRRAARLGSLSYASPQLNMKYSSKSACELEAAKRLVEEKQYQHDMALQVAVAEHQKQQRAEFMLQVQREREQILEEHRNLERRLSLSSLLSKYNGGL